ncbi:uncharacterized protein LOC133916419 [Phragmites australis]|uniref:uncharacterized protein LOC133916419 n=1 Tax=Phragmites australis TaxID=29695 RepID=UPI002D77BDDF|nr:uncharacterized protein LOC133916419 [Phragmites australis]
MGTKEAKAAAEAAAAAAAVDAGEAASTNQHTHSLKGCSSSAEKVYPIHSPLKKRKSQYELIDPRLLSLKYKFRNRLSRQEDESAATESLGYDGIFINNCGTDMMSIPEELESCENTLSLFGGCIEVDSKNGIEGQSLRKMFEAQASTSSSSINNFSSDTFSSSHSRGTRETDSWVMHDVEHDHPGLMLQPQYGNLERIYDVLEQYDDLMKNELACGDVHCSAANVIDEKLYSNGINDFQILPTSQAGYHGEKKLTIDQEFEQYFSRLML